MLVFGPCCGGSSSAEAAASTCHVARGRSELWSQRWFRDASMPPSCGRSRWSAVDRRVRADASQTKRRVAVLAWLWFSSCLRSCSYQCLCLGSCACSCVRICAHERSLLLLLVRLMGLLEARQEGKERMSCLLRGSSPASCPGSHSRPKAASCLVAGRLPRSVSPRQRGRASPGPAGPGGPSSFRRAFC